MIDEHGIDALIEADEQARATIASELSRTLFVEAGAGTGKTSALVGRIVELVLTADTAARKPLSQIAAITFTEAAAAELRERIRSTFEARLREAEKSGLSEIVERCQKALEDADIAAISTLHAFAQRLLSEFPVEVGVPPRVEVIDEVRSQVAFDERWSAFLDSLYEDESLTEFIVRASILGVGLNGPELRAIAQEFDDNWDRLIGVDIVETPPVPIDFGHVREAIHRVEQLPADCSDDADTLLVKLKELQPLFDRFERAGSDYERLRITRQLSALKFGRSGRKPNWVDVVAARECCSALAETSQEVLATISSQTLTRFAARIAAFTRESAQQRRAEGVLEFHDLLVLAQMLLRQSPDARASLAERYSVLMLDEFQDTDPIQLDLALLLASSVTGEFTGDDTLNRLTPDPGRLFMVGDPKQSIYRFRRADIGLFLQARDAFASGGVVLRRNFRTVAPVIDAVNSLFSEVMPDDTESQAKYSPLLATREPSDGDHRPVILGGPLEGPARELRETEAADVAATIADIRDNPAKWRIGTRDGGWREPLLRDITILLPTRTSMSQLSHALDDQDIPFRADTGSLVYETQEIKDLLNVLSAIDDSSNQIALVAALRSPLYACGYDDLYTFVAGGGRFDLAAPIPDALLGSPVAEGLEHLGSLARRRWWDEPSQLLLRIIDERYAMALPAHGRRARDTWRRIRYVVDQARAFAETGGGDLRDYLAWTRLQGFDGSKAHEPMLDEPDDDAVRIMTIHGSKGLEFPITIVSGLTTELGRGRASRGEVIWGEAGVLPEVKVSKNLSTSHFDLAKELDDEMAKPERDRLLYVALTRARDHLVMSSYHGVRKTGKVIESHGSLIYTWAHGAGAELVRPLTGQGSLFALPTDSADPVIDLTDPAEPPTLPTVTDWRTRHRERLARASERSVMSATAIAKEHYDRARDGTAHFGEPDDGGYYAGQHDDVPYESAPYIDDDLDGAKDDTELVNEEAIPQEFRRGRAGTSIGSAVHGVLQLIDLSEPDDADVRALCASQAWVESVPEHVETIEASVRSALSTDIVDSCRTARHWKELFVTAPVGEITIEGYVDLLVETPDGLVVVDYKTDAVRSERDIDAKLERYSLQGAAYAVAVEMATGMIVADVQFVFAQASGPIVRSIDDLALRRRDVIAASTRRALTAQADGSRVVSDQ